MKAFYMDTDLLDIALDSCDLGDGYMAKVRQYPHREMLPDLTYVIEYSAYEQLKKENLLLSDDREMYMRHREILIGALNTIAFEGSSREYCTKISEQALKEIGEI